MSVKYERPSKDDPPFDGEACPACPFEVRGLYAIAHNAVGEWRANGPSARFYRKMGEMADAVKLIQPLIDAHFADRAHAHGPDGPALARVIVETIVADPAILDEAPARPPGPPKPPKPREWKEFA